MTYKRHWLLAFGGTVANGADIWSNNIRIMNQETGSPDDLSSDRMESLLDDFVADIRAFITTPGAYIYNGVTCNWVKFNEIDANGHYADTSKTHARYLNGTGALAPIFGTTGTAVPSFQSVAVTTTTARQRGPGSKGRIFLPQCAPPLAGGGKITTAAATSIANATATFLTALGNENNLDVTHIRPAVISNVGNPGPQEPITGVRVGDVCDVVRRRKNNIPEIYVTASVST